MAHSTERERERGVDLERIRSKNKERGPSSPPAPSTNFSPVKNDSEFSLTR